MSYILDALRKSQAERQRQAPAGLGPVQWAAAAGARPRGAVAGGLLGGMRRGWAIAALAALVMVFVVLVVRPGSPVAAGPTAATVAPAALPAVPAPQAAHLPAGKAVALVPPAAVEPPVPPALPGPPPTVVAPSAPPAPGPSAAPLAQTTQSSQMPAGESPATPRAAPKAGAAEAAAAPIRLQDLNAEQRRELPTFRVSGSVQSSDPDSRLLLINGQVLRQGESLAPGLVLEAITLEAAVFRWREIRIAVALTP